MKEFHKIDNSEVFNFDCVEGMKSYPNNYFDLAIVDPPYGIKRDGKRKSTSKRGGHKGYKFKGWDNEVPKPEYFKELFRVSKNQIIWGANYFPNYLSSSSGWILWDKGQRIDQADGELAFSSFDRALRVFTLNRVAIKMEGAIHPTQKPVKLYDWIYKNYATEGMKVIDTHLGSQSNRISAEKNKIIFTAFETDVDYYNEGNKRFENFKKQLTIF